MDFVTLIGACAIGAGSALFMPLGTHSDCRPDIDGSPGALHDAVSSAVDRWSSLIDEASGRFGVPAQWVREVMSAESGGRELLNGEPITSPAGAMGLMQIMPRTFAELSARYDLGNDPYDPRANILAGTAYLREMYDRFGAPGFVAAYNAGPNRLTELLQSERSLPNETLQYLAQIGDMSLTTGSAANELLQSATKGMGRQARPPATHARDSDLIAQRIGDPAAAELSPVMHSSNPSNAGQQSSSASASNLGDGLFVAIGAGGFDR